MCVCNICQEEVTNPICPDCMEAAIEEWLQYKAPELIDKIRLWTDEIKCHGDTTCIICRREMGVCSYCFHEHLTLRLLETKASIVNEFKQIFSLQPVAID